VVDYEAIDLEMYDIQDLLQHASNYKVLKRAPEARWIKLAQSPVEFVRKKAQATLLNHNLKLIIKMSRRYGGQGVPLQDLIQEASDGLLHAIELFKLDTGNKLSTYAVRWIRQRLGRAIENKSRLVKIPSNRLAEVTTLKKRYAQFVVEENRPPTSKELAEALGWTIAKVEELGRLVYTHTSLDEPTGEDDSLTLVSYLVDEKRLPEDQLEDTLDKDYVRELLSSLNQEEKEFIMLKFGFLDDKYKTDKEMAATVQSTKEVIKEKEARILEKLRAIAHKSKCNLMDD
jgi:RNA polymerase sigma factor (sigma-70 family)